MTAHDRELWPHKTPSAAPRALSSVSPHCRNCHRSFWGCKCTNGPSLPQNGSRRVFVSNWRSRSTAGHHGRGKIWGLVPAPGRRPSGDGWIEHFLPDADAYQVAKDGDADGFLDRFAAAVWERTHEGALLRPGKLLALYGAQPAAGVEMDGGDRSHRAVRDGDTLCCSCSRQAASEGRCHRIVVAHALSASGWEVVLDGVPIGEMAPRPEIERRQAEAPAAPRPAKGPRKKPGRRALPRKASQLGLGWGR